MPSAVMSVNSEESRLNETVGEVRAMHETLGGLKGDVDRVTNRLPAATRGPRRRH